MGAATGHIPRVVILAALTAISQLTLGAQPQIAHVVLEAPEPMPETVGDDADYPFLTRLSGTTLIKTTRTNEPLEVKPASAESEAMLAGLSYITKSYTAPLTLSDAAFVSLYRDALIERGWRILDQPLAAAVEGDPHVINVSAHYTANERDLYARISRAPDGSYEIGVADVGAEDWGTLIDQTCHIPIFSVHFKHDLTLHYEEARPTLEKLAALLRARPKMQIEIQGHSDNVGDEKELVTQSARRASIVNLALINLGVARERLTSRGYGKSRPIAPSDTDWGRTKNRRIEIEKKGCTAPVTPPDKPRRSGA